jgi:hypothetical protein
VLLFLNPIHRLLAFSRIQCAVCLLAAAPLLLLLLLLLPVVDMQSFVASLSA